MRAALTYVLPTSAMVVVNNVLPYCVLAVLIFGSVGYGRRARAGPAIGLLRGRWPRYRGAKISDGWTLQ